MTTELAFHGVKHLRAWLTGHPDGMALLRELREDWLYGTPEGNQMLEDSAAVLHRVPVLVVLYSDGSVEVYAPKGRVAVRIAVKLHATTPESGELAEEYMERSLPRLGRDVYWPVNLAGAGNCRKVTAEMERDARHAAACLRELREVWQ